MTEQPTRRWYETRAQYARRLAAWQAAKPKPTLPASLVGLVNPPCTSNPADTSVDTSVDTSSSSSSDSFSGGGGDFGGGGSDGSW